MTVQDAIISKLNEGLQPTYLDVQNESYMHNVPPDSSTHFKVVIVSKAFADKRSVARHQLVYHLLANELAGLVHALALHTYTPEEWQTRSASAPQSPNCQGGGH
ncbi:BolA family protein [Zooshikella harenae]|uniref:BolA/IbaG family iron-sulfur metabolism protein n=1 Tax=Zooshikella harenae TaxID=2827238 RepID=A0ABS5Z8F0_9GAMM|nr:BolA/IbaG family iron-sulfur metabolism protein [Zooshikella harenae]MBU2710331.1 BolA/IbaG family iron-sulfur metabolism protein [Zooshikella harenae]